MDDMQTMLASAIEDLDIELARMLIVENDVVPKNVDEEAMMLFIQSAVISIDKPLLQRLLKYNKRLNERVLWKVLDNVEVATLFVLAGTDLSVTQSYSSTTTFLHVLLANEDPSKIKLAELMIDKGANVSAIDDYGYTVLQSAVEGGAPVDFIRKIIWNSVADFDKNAVVIAESVRCAELLPTLLSLITANSVNETTKMQRVKDALSLLADEYRACRKDAIIALLELVIPPHVFDSEDEPVLDIRWLLGSDLAGKILWYMFDDIKIANMLVRSGADLSMRNNTIVGSSFLHVLSGSKDPKKLKLAELMMVHNANVSAIDLKGRAVLQCAIEAGAEKDFISKLIWNSSTKFEKNAIIIADSERNEELLPLLVSFALVSSVDEMARSGRIEDAIYSLIESPSTIITQARRTAIAYFFEYAMPSYMFGTRAYNTLGQAILNENYELAEIFLQYGADPNAEYRGLPFLWIAISMEKSSMAMLLIKYGADVHHQDTMDVRTIHMACKSSSINNLLLLIRFGADVNVVDNIGHTPLFVLTENIPPKEHDLYHIIIRRLALEAFKGTNINWRDMALIRKHDILQKLFDCCTDELYQMQKMDVVEGISYSKFLIENIEITSRYTRKMDLTSNSEDDSVLLRMKGLFPCYDYDFQDAYNFAEARRCLVREREQFLSKIVLEVYEITLPDLVIHKIVDYVCFDKELKNFILKFHSSTFQ